MKTSCCFTQPLLGVAEASQQLLHSSVRGSLTWTCGIWGIFQSPLGPCLPQAPCTMGRTLGSGQCCKQYINGSCLLLILHGGSPLTLTYSLMKALQQDSQPKPQMKSLLFQTYLGCGRRSYSFAETTWPFSIETFPLPESPVNSLGNGGGHHGQLVMSWSPWDHPSPQLPAGFWKHVSFL